MPCEAYRAGTGLNRQIGLKLGRTTLPHRKTQGHKLRTAMQSSRRISLVSHHTHRLISQARFSPLAESGLCSSSRTYFGGGAVDCEAVVFFVNASGRVTLALFTSEDHAYSASRFPKGEAEPLFCSLEENMLLSQTAAGNRCVTMYVKQASHTAFVVCAFRATRTSWGIMWLGWETGGKTVRRQRFCLQNGTKPAKLVRSRTVYNHNSAHELSVFCR